MRDDCRGVSTLMRAALAACIEPNLASLDVFSGYKPEGHVHEAENIALVTALRRQVLSLAQNAANTAGGSSKAGGPAANSAAGCGLDRAYHHGILQGRKWWAYCWTARNSQLRNEVAEIGAYVFRR
jgi:hypothetical protein